MAKNAIEAAAIVAIFCLMCTPSFQNTINSVTNVDLLIASNSQRHNTARFYETTNRPDSLIIRRSETFQIRLHLKSPFYSVDRLQLNFVFKTQNESYNVYIPSKSSSWPAKFRFRSNVIDVLISLPSNVPVGFWDLNVYTYRNNLQEYNTYTVKDILILFNPWSPRDTVYMPKLYELNEYVLNEKGYVITGDLRNKDKLYWIHGQFKRTTVDALKIILGKLTLSANDRANPVLFSRALSSMVNAFDNYGVMAGKWSSPYDTIQIRRVNYTARSPLTWTGTPEILEEYIKANGRTLGYAQCWVYASLLTTLGRSLGFPSRTITNFESGHDHDDNVTISFAFDENSKVNPRLSESIWNFHVWTEMYMRRHDLSDDGLKFGGWQILDGTPQKPSTDTPEHYYQMGPASRNAVKMAEVNLKYDTGFAYGEVNADIIHRNYRNEVTGYFENSVGKLMLSKGLDGEVMDLTSEYKHQEGTLEERSSFHHAIKLIYGLPEVAVVTRMSRTKLPRDILVNLTNANSHQYNIGSKVYFDVLVRNQFSKDRIFDVSIDVYSLYYNGKRGNDILKQRYRTNVPANNENVRRYEIDPKDYIYKLVPFSIVRIDILINTAQRLPFKQSYDLKLKKPTLIIKPIGRAVVGKPFYVHVKLLNPLQVPLTKCMFSVQGIRLNSDLHQVKAVKPFENKIYKFGLVFEEAIKETVVFSFTSNELHQIQGSAVIQVNRR